MARKTKRIRVTSHTNLIDVLGEAAAGPVVLENDGVLYRVAQLSPVVEGEDPFAGYDPEAALAGMRSAAGSWSDIDLEALKASVYRGREEGTRPVDRP